VPQTCYSHLEEKNSPPPRIYKSFVYFHIQYDTQDDYFSTPEYKDFDDPWLLDGIFERTQLASLCYSDDTLDYIPVVDLGSCPSSFFELPNSVPDSSDSIAAHQSFGIPYTCFVSQRVP